MTGKPLSALLQILRSAGVTEYQTPQLTIKLGPPPAPRPARGTVALNLSPEALAAGEREPDEAEDDPSDFRFALERLQPKHFPRPNKARIVERKGTQ